ncbi:hypothetical protein EJ07DRAFT_154024 [Lizonia empirigonia]|nr:hypothetical protein EJ07DRAFT_154024 [Lizonia empirigonia]
MSSSSFPPSELREIATEVASLLKERKETISVAETAAGGLISAALLALPDASTYYAGPSPAVVALLARNTREKLGSEWTVAESGTAGPTGGEVRERTPGFVALGVCWRAA